MVWPILDDLVEMTSISPVGYVLKFVFYTPLSNWSSNNHELKKNYLCQTISRIDKEFVRGPRIWKSQFSSCVGRQVVILVETMQSISNLEFCKFTQSCTKMRTYRSVKYFTTSLNMKFVSLIWLSRSPPLVLVNVVIRVSFVDTLSPFKAGTPALIWSWWDLKDLGTLQSFSGLKLQKKRSNHQKLLAEQGHNVILS